MLHKFCAIIAVILVVVGFANLEWGVILKIIFLTLFIFVVLAAAWD